MGRRCVVQLPGKGHTGANGIDVGARCDPAAFQERVAGSGNRADDVGPLDGLTGAVNCLNAKITSLGLPGGKLSGVAHGAAPHPDRLNLSGLLRGFATPPGGMHRH